MRITRFPFLFLFLPHIISRGDVMKKLIFKGVGTAIVTPFTEDGDINYEEFEKILEFQIRNGVNAIIVCGTTGESATLSREEKKTIIFVTHDIEEAVFLADRIVVMMADPGRIKSVVKVPLGDHRDRTGENFLYVRDRIFDLFNMKSDEYIEYYI